MPSGQGEIPLTASAEASARPNSPDTQSGPPRPSIWLSCSHRRWEVGFHFLSRQGRRFLRAITRVSETAVNTSKSDTNSTALGAPELPTITIPGNKIEGRGRLSLPRGRRPPQITQPDVARVLRAAKQAGAAEVVVKVADYAMIVRFAPSTGQFPQLAPSEEIVL
jgi:hypothetical protein